MQHSQTTPNRWLSLAVLCLSLFIISLDNTVLNMALPSIARDLESSASELQWIADAYTLVFAASLLTLGSISDRHGRKRVLLVGVLIFGVGSLLATMSGSSTELILIRALLGFGGAMIMPSTLSIITATFHDPVERTKAIMIWTAIFGVGAGLGPLVGGYLLEYFEWTALFYLNVPVAIFSLIAIMTIVPESCDKKAPRIDLPGSLLSIIGLITLVYGIIHAGESGWTDQTVLLSLGAALIALGIFVWWERKTPEPMLPLEFFKNPSFSGASIAVMLNSFGMFGALYFLSQYLQTVMGYSALNAAIRMLPMIPVMFIATPISLKVVEKVGYKFTISLGIFISALGMLILSQVVSVTMPYSSLLLVLIVFPAGLGLIISPATNSIMASVPVERAGVSSAVNDMLREIGGALGVAVFGALMNSVYRTQIDDLDVVSTMPEEAVEVVRSSIQAAHMVAAEMPDSLVQVANAIVAGANDAFVAGMAESTVIAAIIMAVAGVFALIVIPTRPLPMVEHEPEPSSDEQLLNVDTYAESDIQPITSGK